MARFITIALFCWVLAHIIILTPQASAHSSPDTASSAPAAREGSESVSSVAERPVSSHAEPSLEGAERSEPQAEAPEIRRMGKHRSDKSVAGGGVIIGGLVTAIFAAVFCYIRVTRKRGGVY